jgi:beta-glucosidase
VNVVITENGLPDDTMGAPGDDQSRIDFLRDHLLAVQRATADGASVLGYHAWSLLDNFEWARGYTQRCGLVHVDFDTQRRTPKTSARWLTDVINQRSAPER